MPEHVWLYRSMDKDSRRLRNRSRGGDLFHVARVVTKHGGWWQIEMVGTYNTHCHGEFFGASDIELRFFVRKKELARVTDRDLNINFKDGSEVRLLPGIVATPASNGRHRVRVRGIEYNVRLPKAATALTYHPSPQHVQPAAKYAVSAQRRPMLDGQPVRSFWFWSIADVEPKGERVLATVITGCQHLKMWFDRKHIEDLSKYTSGTFSGLLERPSMYVDKATRVFWPDGAPAGKTRRRFEIARAKSIGALVCIWRPFDPRPRSKSDLGLCFDSKDVKKIKP